MLNSRSLIANEPPRFGSALSMLLKTQVSKLSRALSRKDKEALHASRVSLRRLITSVWGYSQYLRTTPSSSLLRRLRATNRIVSRCRNLEVQVADLEARLRSAALAPKKKEYVRAVLAQLKQQSRAERALAFPVLRQDATSLSGTLTREVEALQKPLWSPPVETALLQAVERAKGNLRESLRQARRNPSRKSLHALRIDVKTMRYLLEPHANNFGAARELLRPLGKLQTSLGQLRDRQALLRSVESQKCKSLRKLPGYKNFKRDLKREIKECRKGLINEYLTKHSALRSSLDS